jgi:alkanesulfonate monooxygenase SsuD/methylene tetrahydromethanopterin reductase-like flavin-dependent oxidoreductase (luciferase family)
MDYGVGLFPTEPLQKMIHLAKVTEETGYSHIWVGDSHLIWREAYINMAAIHRLLPAAMQRSRNMRRDE